VDNPSDEQRAEDQKAKEAIETARSNLTHIHPKRAS
jgi:hypothetical protein